MEFAQIFEAGNPVIECPTDGRKTKILHRQFIAWTPWGVVTVPEGYETDGFSIPQALWSLIGSPWNRFAPAAIVHDYLYTTNGLGVYTRAEADKIFKWLLLVLGMGEIRARAMYRGVQVGGWVGWNRHKKAARRAM